MERGREKFRKYKKLIMLLAKWYSIFPKRYQKKLLVKYRKTTGAVGLVIRYALLKNLAKHVGENVSIHPDVYLFNVENLSIGNNVSIHPMCYIEAWSGVTIGDDVSIAHAVTIMAASHGYENLEIPIKDQPLKECPITIADNVWIGAKAVVLGGNLIREGAVIGAGAVITKEVAANTIVVGVPATVLKRRA